MMLKILFSPYFTFADLNVSSVGEPQYPWTLVSDKKRNGQWD